MRVRRVILRHFRGVAAGTVRLDGNTLLVGSNSVGKSTVCEALDLVLGPERMFRRPVIDEYDFYAARYQAADGVTPEVRVEVVLTDLEPEAQRRFRSRLRRWSAQQNDFIAPKTSQETATDGEEGEWCLPVVFVGRFNQGEDDFEGATFFAHPEPIPDDLTEETVELGGGLKPFTREDKRLCGFLYLRPNRTGSRALSFQRGSLLDTIVRLESESAGQLWEKALRGLSEVVIAGDESGFMKIRSEVRTRVEKFLSLTEDPGAVDVRVSELTREHVRDTLRLFLATQPGAHGVPFNRLSTGSLNLLVFALLTYIAELKGDQSVIFAMEEPEIALPPHAQRRLVDFVVSRMGQVIITSHSPYVIEKFNPDQVVVLARDNDGALTSTPVALPADFKLKKYRDNRRQFAEAILARAVLVVEGATEVAAFQAVADVLDRDPAVVDYLHPDLAGISLFDANNDVSVPLFAPVFAAMGKRVFGFHDRPDKPLSPALEPKIEQFTRYQQIPYKGIETLLVTEMPVEVQKQFAATVAGRPDYPTISPMPPAATDDQVRAHVRKLLEERKGSNGGYAALLISECGTASDLPASLADFLRAIDADLRPAAPVAANPVRNPGS
ncbi:ATP-dependent nuclease [Micromonospora orduensis]|uniref:ATP-dependent nuclease n=1 Tax=Micromonospora orduensis TaxID=1420891 RepID=UPI0038234F09